MDQPVVIKGRVGDDELRAIYIDRNTGAIISVSNEHHEAHDENAYYVVHSELAGNTDDAEVRIQTPDVAERAHMTIIIDSAIAATVALWKNTTMTHVANNIINPMNRDHDSVNTSGLTICHTPGGSQAGNPAITRYIGSASVSGKADVGGSGGSRGEFILSRNMTYLIRVTSRADDNALSIILDYYMHEPKN